MGGAPSTQRYETEEKSVKGLLSIRDLANRDLAIENLAFAGGSAEAFSYAGAVRVLERLGILSRAKRFAGVGTGAIVAAFCSLGFSSKEIQIALCNRPDELHVDNTAGDDGWNFEAKFKQWFGRHLKLKSIDSEMSFRQLFENTGKELCIVVTNIDKLTTEYCHPKTTPNLPIKIAVFMSICTPGVFPPVKIKHGTKTYHYANGGLMCNYPVHCFDGRLLSMRPEDSLLDLLESLDVYHSRDKVFNGRNERTLGFFRFDGPEEIHYKEFVNRLLYAGANLNKPNTTLGERYETASKTRSSLVEKFSLLRKTSTNMLHVADEMENKDKIFIYSFAEKIFASDSLPRDDLVLLFPEFGRNVDDFIDFLTSLAGNDRHFSLASLKDFLQGKLVSLLNDYSDHSEIKLTNSVTYFKMVFNALPLSGMNISESDYSRSVGIPSGHVRSYSDVCLEADDKAFLFRQGWNATVAYFRQTYKPPTLKSERIADSNIVLPEHE